MLLKITDTINQHAQILSALQIENSLKVWKDDLSDIIYRTTDWISIDLDSWKKEMMSWKKGPLPLDISESYL